MKKKNNTKKQHFPQNAERMISQSEIQYASPWMMICMVNPSVMDGRKIAMMMDRILQEKTPNDLKAWI